MLRDADNLADVAHRQDAARRRRDLEGAAERVVVAEAGEGREQVRLLLRRSGNGGLEPVDPSLEALDRLGGADDADRDLVVREGLERAMANEAEARIDVLAAVSEFQLGLFKERRR
jgi:hypothetical protein